jgi:acetoin utilization deacetylase AcuC-like enzyme
LAKRGDGAMLDADDAGRKRLTTLLISHAACLEHDMGEGHPERPDRYRVVERALEAEVFQQLERESAPQADKAALTRVHPLEYVERLESLSPPRNCLPTWRSTR